MYPILLRATIENIGWTKYSFDVLLLISRPVDDFIKLLISLSIVNEPPGNLWFIKSLFSNYISCAIGLITISLAETPLSCSKA